MHHIVPKFKSLLAASSLEACFMNSICVRRRLSHTFRMCKFLRTLLRPRISRSRVIWLTTGEIHTKHKFCPHDTYLKSLTERTDFFRAKPTLNINELVRSIHYLPAAAIDTPQLQTSSFLWLRTVRVDKRQGTRTFRDTTTALRLNGFGRKASSGDPPWT